MHNWSSFSHHLRKVRRKSCKRSSHQLENSRRKSRKHCKRSSHHLRKVRRKYRKRCFAECLMFIVARRIASISGPERYKYCDAPFGLQNTYYKTGYLLGSIASKYPLVLCQTLFYVIIHLCLLFEPIEFASTA